MRKQSVIVALAVAASLCHGLHCPAGAQADQMINSANQQIRANPGSFAGYAMRAMGESASGQNDLAVADLQKSLSLKPGNAPSYSVYAMIAMKAGRYQEAIDYADKALAAHPHLFNALQIKAGAYEKLGRMDVVEQVKAEFTGERNRRGAAYENDLGFEDPPAAITAPGSNTFAQTQHPWLPPANNALLNARPSQAPAGFSNSSGMMRSSDNRAQQESRVQKEVARWTSR